MIGLTGLMGCGTTELMQCLFGLAHPTGGTATAFGRRLAGGSIHEAMKAGIAMLPSDRKENSVVPDMSLLENMYLSEHVLSARRFVINRGAEQERFERYRKLLSIKANSSGDSVLSLSGGNQQKVFMARWLVNYNCVFLDTSPIRIGEGTFIAPGCVLGCAGHAVDPAQRAEGIQTSAPITIGDNVWLGANVTVCGGVTIGDGAVIGAGSVVTRDVPAGVLAAGVPCRVIREVARGDLLPARPELLGREVGHRLAALPGRRLMGRRLRRDPLRDGGPDLVACDVRRRVVQLHRLAPSLVS